MKITSEIIKGVLRGMFSDDGAIIHKGMHFHLQDIVSRLTVGLNDLIARGDQMEFLKREQANLDTLHVDATGEIEAEMAILQAACPHFSHSLVQIPFTSEVALELGKSMGVEICDICGKILDKEMFGDIQ